MVEVFRRLPEDVAYLLHRCRPRTSARDAYSGWGWLLRLALCTCLCHAQTSLSLARARARSLSLSLTLFSLALRVLVRMRVRACVRARVLCRLPDDVRGLKQPREICLKICLVLVALTWFWNNVHVLQYLDLRQQIYGWFRPRACKWHTTGVLPVLAGDPPYSLGPGFLHRDAHARARQQ